MKRKRDKLPPVIKVQPGQMWDERVGRFVKRYKERSFSKQLGAALTSDDLMLLKKQLGVAMDTVCRLIGEQNARDNEGMNR